MPFFLFCFSNVKFFCFFEIFFHKIFKLKTFASVSGLLFSFTFFSVLMAGQQNMIFDEVGAYLCSVEVEN